MNEQKDIYEFDYAGLIARISDVLGKESYLSFAKRAGMSDTAFKRYIINGTVPPVDKAWMIACAAANPSDDAADIRKLASWIAFGLGDRPGYSSRTSAVKETLSDYDTSSTRDDSDDIEWIDSYNVFASAGNGFINEYELGNKLPFSHRWLAENGLLGKRLSLIRVTGNSMHPTLSDKETPLIEILPDDAINRLVDDVYVIRLNGQLLIKRIQVYGNDGFLIKSDNAHYDSYKLTRDNWPDDFKVIAKWTGKKF